jgi:NAD(P)H-hydrate epimerase
MVNMRLVTTAEMQEIDRRTIAAGIPVATLMERAGAAVAAAAERLAGLPKARIAVLCGKGHNGGDGLVAARLLHQRGHDIRVGLTHARAELASETRIQLEVAERAGVQITFWSGQLHDPGPRTEHETEFRWMQPDPFGEALRTASVCIDAVLGIGATQPLRGITATAVHWLQRTAGKLLAVDVPSGIDATSGAVLGSAVWADVTVTIGLPKLGLALEPGRQHAGRVEVCDIGFPPEIVSAVTAAGIDRRWIDGATARRLLPRLHPATHKYDRGCALVVAGSRAYPGAAVLAAMAASRSGAGIVHLAAPAGIRALLQSKLTEVIVHSLPETTNGTLARTALEPVLEIASRADALAIGPGLTLDPETMVCARELLAAIEIPAVVDADAIPALPAPPHRAGRIVTPHAGELARWIGVPVAAVSADRLETARRTAVEAQCVVVAKGAPTVIATPGGALHVNSTGGPMLATAGSGDVLTGILAGWLAHGLDCVDAARLGVFLHGRTGELAAGKSSVHAVVASDLIQEIGRAQH